MNIKRLGKSAVIFCGGLIVGVFGVSFLFWGCEGSRFSRAPMTASPSTGQTSQGITIELGADAYHGITILRSNEHKVISPPPNVIWTRMAVANSANAVYLLAYDEISHWIYNPRALVGISLPKESEPLFKYTQTELLGSPALSNMIGDAFICELDGISADGTRLLLRLGLRDQTNSPVYSARLITTKPYYYYPAEGRLEAISP
jgi:hypothetical protein